MRRHESEQVAKCATVYTTVNAQPLDLHFQIGETMWSWRQRTNSANEAATLRDHQVALRT